MPDRADSAGENLVGSVRTGLADVADGQRAPQMAAYMRSSMP